MGHRKKKAESVAALGIQLRKILEKRGLTREMLIAKHESDHNWKKKRIRSAHTIGLGFSNQSVFRSNSKQMKEYKK